jgi:hypothetical protein
MNRPSIHAITEDDPAGARAEFEVVTSKGVPIRTFDDRAAAVKWLTKPDERGIVKLSQYPGATIQEAIYQAPIRRTVWREPKLRLVERVS